MISENDVVITGIGIVSPIGIGADAYWEGLLKGRSGIRDLDHIPDAIESYCFGGQLSDYDPKAYVKPRKSLKVMCREVSTAFSACTLAIQDGDLDSETIPKERIATIFGSEMLYGGPDELVDASRRCCNGQGFDDAKWGESAMREMYPLWMLKYLPNMAACHIGIALGAHGPNNTIVMGDVSGLSALGEGVSVIQRGLADVAIVCSTGTRISMTRILYRGDYVYGSRRDPIAQSSRPFATDRDGVVGGEGAGAVILERRGHAAGRGAAPIATIGAVTSNFGSPQNRGSSEALSLSIRSALERSGINSNDVGIAVSHAMGDRDLDRIDAEVHNELLPNAVVTAPKGGLGHTGAGCGIIELSAGALALRHGVVPPTVNGNQVDPDLGIQVATEPVEVATSYAIQSNHTVQGNAVCAILKPGEA